jgi:hypothetical protein
LWDVVKSVLSFLFGTGFFVGFAWYLFKLENTPLDLEKEGDEDANKALEDLDDKSNKNKAKGKKGKEDKNSAKDEKK